MVGISRRTLFKGLAASSTALALSSCAGAGGTSGGGSGADSEELNVLMVGNPQMTDLEGLSSRFTEQTRIRLNITILPENELRDRVAQDVSTQGGLYDVVTIGAYEGSVWTANDWLHNLQEMAEADPDFDVADIMPAMKGVLSKGDDLHAMPFYGESAFTMYRKDIFDKHGLTMPGEPTWTEIRELAEQLKTLEPGMNPIVLRGLPGWGENMAVLGAMLNSFGGGFFDADWNPMLTSPETKRCIEFYVDLVRNFGQSGATTAGFTECLNIMSQGEGCMWFDATSAANSLESPTSSKVVGKMGYVDAPSEVMRSGWVWAWAWGIPRTTKHLDNAWKFVAWASSKEYEQLVGKELGWTRVPDGKRQSTFEIPEYKEASAAYSKVMQDAIAASKPLDCGAYPHPGPGCQYLAIPEFGELGTTFGQEISAALAGHKSVDEALQVCQNAAQDVADKHK